MSSNNTHFGTLTNDNEVIFEWKNEMNQQIGLSVSFDSALNCYNILLSQNFTIVIDCYYNNEFLLIQLSDEQSKIAYSIESIQPTQTKIKSIIKGTNVLYYMPNMIRIIQYFYYFHQLFVIKVVQIINLSISMSLLQQALIFMRQYLLDVLIIYISRCSNLLKNQFNLFRFIFFQNCQCLLQLLELFLS
ncbi:unnamed protein product [Paramecium sonneborni]|uniref:Transmembrane protein n=1 Tax=Paramecium sonneborni TaxID=65129 RepID=A0A8S1RTP4_9CILI|nr:unnamed protein product [Paramecium sonneborni]